MLRPHNLFGKSYGRNIRQICLMPTESVQYNYVLWCRNVRQIYLIVAIFVKYIFRAMAAEFARCIL